MLMTNLTFNPPILDTVTITVIGKAVAKQGSQSRLVSSSQGDFIQQYTPEHVTNWAAYVKLVAASQRREPLWDGPIRVTMLVKKLRPKAHKKRVFCHTKPDLDNIEKNMYDALQGVIYANDARIVDKHITKIFSDVEEVIVKLELLQDN